MNTLPCTSDPEVWFNLTPRNIAQAKAGCAICPERTDCLSNALAAESGETITYRFGVYGGTEPHERFALDARTR